MRSSSFVAPCAAALVLLLLLQAAVETAAAAAAKCDRQDLTAACRASAVTGNTDAHCCAKLKEHVPCLCEYMKDPVVWKYVQTEKGHHLFEACQVKFPSYCPHPAFY